MGCRALAIQQAPVLARQTIEAPRRESRFPRQAGRCSRRQRCSSPNESGAFAALLDLAGCSSLIAPRQGAGEFPVFVNAEASDRLGRCGYGPNPSAVLGHVFVLNNVITSPATDPLIWAVGGLVR